MMISFYRTAIAVILIAILSGCSLFGNNEPEYLASVEAYPLRVPEGLDDPTGPSPVIISVPEMRLPAGDELEPMPPRVVSTAGREDANAYLAWSAEGAYMLVKDTPDNVVHRLLSIIEGSGTTMTLLRKDDDAGAHKFHYSQPKKADEGFFSNMAFWRSDPFDYSGTFMTSLRADGKNTRVYLLFGTGEACDTAGSEHILGMFMERLG
jgi:uncharacterized lipoprotein